MAHKIVPVRIYYIAEGEEPAAFDVEIADDDNRYTYDGWLPLALEETEDGPRVAVLGDNWLSTPGDPHWAPPDAGPLAAHLTAADCRRELAARLEAGVHDYSGEWPEAGYDEAVWYRYMAVNVAETLGPLLARLEEEQEAMEALGTEGLEHLEISIGTLQFRAQGERLHEAPEDKEGVYARAVEDFVKSNLQALQVHVEQRGAETRERIGRVMRAAVRLGAFDEASRAAR